MKLREFQVPDTYLDEFDKDEWYSIMNKAKRSLGGGSLDRDEFDILWEEFQKLKTEHQRWKSLN